MADQRITELTLLTEADVNALDVLPIVDISASETKKVRAKDLFEAGATLADSGSIDIIKLNQSSATKLATVAIADDAITAAKLANDSSINYGPTEPAADNFEGRGHVNSTTKYLKIYDGSVYQQVIAPTAGIEDLAVTTGKIAANAVTTAKIDASGLAAAAIATDAVITAKIQASAVTEAKIAAGAVTETKIADNAVTAAKIATNAVGSLELADDAVDTASIVNSAVTETKIGTGAVTVTKIADTSITYAKLNVADNAFPGAKLVDASVTAAKLATDSVSTAKVIDLAVTTGKLAAGAVTTAKIAAGAVTATEIATDAVTTAKVINDAVTYAKIQNVTATDKLLGRATAGAGDIEEITLTAAGRALLDDVDATAQRTTLGLGTLATQSGTVSGTHSGTSSGTNTGDQTITLTGDVTGTGTGSFAASIATNAVITAKIADSNVTTAKINAGAVTGAKLAASSSTVVSGNAPTGSGEFTGQQWVNTNTALAYVWDGSAWLQQAGVQSFVFTDTSPLAFSSTVNAAGVATITSGLDTQTAATIFSGPTTGSAAAPTFRALVASDLPVATASVNGTMQPGTGLTVTGGGVLNHVNSATAGTFTKVTIDAQGHASSGTTLAAGDIPNLDATKITTGSLDAARIAANTVTGAKVANYAVAKIGDTTPTADYISQFFFNPLSRDLFLWDGNVYQPIGISIGEIVFAGTFDASLGSGTGLIASVTAEGTAIGLAIGQVIPAAAAGNSRYYLVVSEAGTITTGNAPHIALTPPDIVLSNGATWTEIDVSQTITAQVATNVSFTPAGSISASNVQLAIQELDTEKLPIAGGTITGNLEIGTAGSLSFEGSTANTFETTLAVVDPTVDRTITLPDVTGTVITTGDTGTVTSTMLLDGTILDADVNASAAIAYSKLATLTSGNIVLGSSANVATSRAVTGDVTISNTGVTAIASGVIVDADINASAAIVDTKLATISTGGKVSNSATTATNANTASAIVARDASGNFSAGTITAALTGTASGNLVSGGALGTPSSGTLTSCTGLPISTGVSGLGTGAATFLTTPSSANFAALLTDETGTGANVFATSPTLVTPLLGTPTSGALTNCTGLPISGLTASTSTALGVGSIELGNASDTTLSRSAAGVLAVEGVVIPSISSTSTLTNKTLTSPVLASAIDVTGRYAQTVVAVAALDIDCSAGNYFTKTINGNSTFTFSSVPASRAFSFVLELTHTSGTVTWPASVKFPGDTAPTLTTGKTHLFIFVTDDGGTRFRGASLVDYVN